MTWQKSPLNLAPLTLTLSLELLLIPGLPTPGQAQSPLAQGISRHWEVSQIFRPPNRKAPATPSGGATRSDCLVGEKTLTPLIPANSLPLTVAEYPTFFWSVPQSNADSAVFMLLDEKDEVIYQTTIPLSGTPGIVSFKLPAKELPPLKIGKMYHWFLALNCNSEDANPFVDGWVERTELSSTLKARLEKATPRDRPSVYADAGIWHEALTSLAELRRSSPNDTRLAANWKQLLQSVELDSIAEQPLVESCNSKCSAIAP